MRAKPSIYLLAMLVIAPAAQAQPTPSPLFAAFQRFCADPDMSPQEIRLAVEVAGGKLAGPPASTDVPQKISVTAWNVTMQGHKLLINAGGVRAPHGPGMVQDMESCTVIDYDSDGAAMAELKQWVAIPPSPPGSPFYDFEWAGQKHVPVPTDNAFRADGDAGKIWQLTINGEGKFVSVMLAHFLKPVPKQ